MATIVFSCVRSLEDLRFFQKLATVRTLKQSSSFSKQSHANLCEVHLLMCMC